MSQLLGRICKMSMAKWQVYLSARPKGGQYHASSNSKPCWERFQTPNLPRYHGYDQCIPAWKWFVSISLTPFEARRHVKSKREQAGDFHIFTSSTLLQNLHSAICKREAIGISNWINTICLQSRVPVWCWEHAVLCAVRNFCWICPFMYIQGNKYCLNPRYRTQQKRKIWKNGRWNLFVYTYLVTLLYFTS